MIIEIQEYICDVQQIIASRPDNLYFSKLKTKSFIPE